MSESNTRKAAYTIGLISDTHMPDRCRILPPAVFDVFRGVELILHAGDVGDLWVLDRLSAIAPVVAVHGNDDTVDAQRELPYQQIVGIGGLRILLSHFHYPNRAEELESRRDDRWEPKLERRATAGRQAGASVVVFGHSHIPMAVRYEGVMLVNPGAIASGNEVTRQRRKSVAILSIGEGAGVSATHFDLVAPNEAFVPEIDLSAGFRAALDQYSESILASGLARDWDRLLGDLRQSDSNEEVVRSLRAALKRVAHSCWSGEQDVITRADLIQEVIADPAMTKLILDRFRAGS